MHAPTTDQTSGSAIMNHSDTADPPGAPRHTPPALNFDIVRAILAYCRTADLLQASLASHALRDEAMNELVSRPVHLKGADQANSFSRFMLAGEGFRLPLLRALTLEDIPFRVSESWSWPSDLPDESKNSNLQDQPPFDLIVALSRCLSALTPIRDILLEVLVRATALRDISILRCGQLFSTGSKFTDAVSALPHLRHLCYFVDNSSCHTDAANLVLDLTSSLETLKYPLNIGEYQLYSQGFLIPPYFENSFLDTLANRQPHLKTLLFTCESLTSATSWTTPFRLVRVLDLTILDRTIDFRHFAYLFPSLMELTIYAYGASSYSVHHASASRQFSIASQEAGYGWPCLDVLCGSLVDLYILAVTAPVHRLGVRARGFRLSNGAFGNVNAANLPDMFADVISRSRPQCVELEFDAARSLHRSLGTVSNLLVYGGHDEHHPAGAVSHLVMGCFFRARPPLPNYTPPSTSDILNMISPLLEHSRVEYLHLTLTHSSVCHDWRTIAETEFLSTGTGIINPPAAVTHAMSSIDSEALASGLVASGTHIRTVAVTILTRGQSVWEVERTNLEGARTLRKLDAYTARQVIAREERR